MTKGIQAVAVIGAAALMAAAGAHANTGISDAEIKLGMVNVQSGPASGLGKGMRAGAEAVFKDVNAKGGVHGRKINLFVGDDGYEPNRAVDETLKMIDEQKVFSLFGYVGTPTANAVIPIVKEMKVPLVGVFTGAMTLRSPVAPEIINIRASYDDESEALVAHFLKAGAKSVAVFYQDDGFGLAVLSGTEKALKKRGMEVAAKGTFPRNTTAIKTGLAAMVSAKPDAIVMVGPYAPLAEFIREARAAGLKSQLATVSFVGTDNLVAAVGKDGDGVVISQVVPFPGDESLAVTRECSEIVGKHAGEKLGFVNFEGCITAKAMVTALEKAGKGVTRESLIQTMEGFKGLDLGGLALTLAPDNHQALNQVFMTEIRDGKIGKIK
ncbi:MAG TPA: ABC transporter substrate-binding protein [Burkholderiales bacterium]|nr:ABC transporter substrate-binding protein [Burkholderiales bacterium]